MCLKYVILCKKISAKFENLTHRKNILDSIFISTEIHFTAVRIYGQEEEVVEPGS